MYARRRTFCSSVSAELTTSRLKPSRMRPVVSTPTIAAKPQRMTSVSSAEPPARRQRIGRRLYAEDVARAADRMEESRLATGVELSSPGRDEDPDRGRAREPGGSPR